MLLIAYLYGIKSERRLEQKVPFNLAYCWFFGDYYGAAEQPVRCGKSHLSGPTEPLRFPG